MQTTLWLFLKTTFLFETYKFLILIVSLAIGPCWEILLTGFNSPVNYFSVAVISLPLKVSNRQLAQVLGTVGFLKIEDISEHEWITTAKHHRCECNSFFLVQGPCPSSFLPQTFIEHLLCSSWGIQINKTDMVLIYSVLKWYELRDSSFIYLFNKHSCGAWYLTVLVLGVGHTGLNKTDVDSAFVHVIIWVGRDVRQQS